MLATIILLVILGVLAIGMEFFLPGGILGIVGAASLSGAVVMCFTSYGASVGLIAAALAVIFVVGALTVWLKFFDKLGPGRDDPDPEPEPAGEWMAAHDFSGLDEGPLDGFGGWTATDGTGIRSDDGNKMILAEGGGQNAYASLGGTIASGSSGTVFFRARPGEMPDFVLGVSDVAEPNAWDEYEGYMRFAGTNIDVRDGGGFTTVLENFSAESWYNIWLVLDNRTLETTLYYSTGAEAAQLGGSGAFRMTGGNTVTGDLINFLVRTGTAHTTGQVDDIYLASGQNLAVPQAVLDAIGGEMPSDEAPEITGVSRSADGILLTFSEGITYDIEYSIDLVTWETIASDVSGSFEDDDPRAKAGIGFYRGVVK